ncbi:MAG: dynamin family protein [Cellvibrionales bacterium]|nr:dynamin family protein [Cellvibrionales bacterium]
MYYLLCVFFREANKLIVNNPILMVVFIFISTQSNAIGTDRWREMNNPGIYATILKCSSKLKELGLKIGKDEKDGKDGKDGKGVEVQMLLVGAQSSGKSSTFDRIAGADLTVKQQGVGTRCPTYLHVREKELPEEKRYTIKRQAVGSVPKVCFESENPKDIQKKFKEITERIERTSQFSDTPIHILIKYGKEEESPYTGLVLADMPGTQLSGDTYHEIDRIIQSTTGGYAGKNVNLYFVVNGEQDFETQVFKAPPLKGCRVVPVMTHAGSKIDNMQRKIDFLSNIQIEAVDTMSNNHSVKNTAMSTTQTMRRPKPSVRPTLPVKPKPTLSVNKPRLPVKPNKLMGLEANGSDNEYLKSSIGKDQEDLVIQNNKPEPSQFITGDIFFIENDWRSINKNTSESDVVKKAIKASGVKVDDEQIGLQNFAKEIKNQICRSFVDNINEINDSVLDEEINASSKLSDMKNFDGKIKSTLQKEIPSNYAASMLKEEQGSKNTYIKELENASGVKSFDALSKIYNDYIDKTYVFRILTLISGMGSICEEKKQIELEIRKFENAETSKERKSKKKKKKEDNEVITEMKKELTDQDNKIKKYEDEFLEIYKDLLTKAVSSLKRSSDSFTKNTLTGNYNESMAYKNFNHVINSDFTSLDEKVREQIKELHLQSKEFTRLQIAKDISDKFPEDICKESTKLAQLACDQSFVAANHQLISTLKAPMDDTKELGKMDDSKDDEENAKNMKEFLDEVSEHGFCFEKRRNPYALKSFFEEKKLVFAEACKSESIKQSLAQAGVSFAVAVILAAILTNPVTLGVAGAAGAAAVIGHGVTGGSSTRGLGKLAKVTAKVTAKGLFGGLKNLNKVRKEVKTRAKEIGDIINEEKVISDQLAEKMQNAYSEIISENILTNANHDITLDTCHHLISQGIINEMGAIKRDIGNWTRLLKNCYGDCIDTYQKTANNFLDKKSSILTLERIQKKFNNSLNEQQKKHEELTNLKDKIEEISCHLIVPLSP